MATNYVPTPEEIDANHRPIFTRQHYEFIARIFSEMKTLVKPDGSVDLDRVIREFAYEFGSDNPNFHLGRFLEASGHWDLT